MIRVKICGITDLEDALLAVELGTQALGFVFAPSPRQVTPEKARAIIKNLPPFVTAVGVFVDEEPGRVREIFEYCGLDLYQFHGRETPNYCRGFSPRALKALRPQGETDLQAIAAYQDSVRAILLDTYQKSLAGGTGRTFPWDLAIKAKQYRLPIILSGGLNPANIREAILTVWPYAVDVSSGIEERPGKKDPSLMRQLMEAIHEGRRPA